MGLSNAERQARWRAKRAEEIAALRKAAANGSRPAGTDDGELARAPIIKQRPQKATGWQPTGWLVATPAKSANMTDLRRTWSAFCSVWNRAHPEVQAEFAKVNRERLQAMLDLAPKRRAR